VTKSDTKKGSGGKIISDGRSVRGGTTDGAGGGGGGGGGGWVGVGGGGWGPPYTLRYRPPGGRLEKFRILSTSTYGRVKKNLRRNRGGTGGIRLNRRPQ